ncbi:MAG: ABC transporter substrate-binding protein [Oligoflexales bacterium]|nr:ABC transporter substrate-binding protein [Oligoflexales bacterium]
MQTRVEIQDIVTFTKLLSVPRLGIFSRLPYILLLFFFSLTASIEVQAQEAKVKVVQPKMKTVGITEIVAHPSLLQAKEGVLAGLRELGFEEGKNLRISEKNAQGSIVTANLIARQFIDTKVDLIIPISTPSAQAVLQVMKRSKGLKIPIVFSSVSDPRAARLLDSDSGVQITGAFDQPSLGDTLKLIYTVVPTLTDLGVLYNAGEANSVKAVELLRAKVPATVRLHELAIHSSNLVSDAVRSLAGKVGALYIPSDNTVFSALKQVIQLARSHKIPTFTNDPDSVSLGVLACHGYSQFAVGRTAGLLAARVLKGESFDKLPPSKPEKAEFYFNQGTAKILAISIPKEIEGVVTQSVP